MSVPQKIQITLLVGYVSIISIILSISMALITGITSDGDTAGIIICICFIVFIISLSTFIVIGRNNIKFSYKRCCGHLLTNITNYGKEGIPNNSYKDFQIAYKSLINHTNSTINITEIKKGIYECVIGEKKLLLDMQGWWKAEYYIYEYLLLIIQIGNLNNINSNKLSKSTVSNRNMLKIFFPKSKKSFYLIKNNKTVLSFNFKYNLICKMGAVEGKKIDINSFYQFNK